MKVFIGCGSNENIESKYLEETKRICQILIDRGYDLVFGAYNKGMMNICYEEFSNSKEVVGINIKAYGNMQELIPKAKVIDVDTSFDRLKKEYDLTNVFLMLPGGIGTYAEIFGVLEELKTSKYKKIILYNMYHFYDKLIEFLNLSKEYGFIKEEDLNHLIIVETIEDLEGELK